ncbi:hypothetical protein A1O7_03094 [Cladophialophora yegresii CBS 114405]|uniref:Uncharacterized protein n=1 Tax=Cladophialophora yegresii CBS 114405 TaxID=1182544 RepID=W9WDL7_9EURO|nr:uncharacterized protein A1O7_03094 [Cladophialophora yegresii CBS 114405]EXJ62656.1 hypothetical protein A1O7_03094 [Cladophialophora yegresii CBS 114405]
MIEAAERGEDFTLGTRGTKRRRKKKSNTTRSFSAVALQEPYQHPNDDIPKEPPVQLEAQHIQFFRKVIPRESNPRAGGASQPRATPTKGAHSLTFEKILQASNTHQKVPDYRASSRPKAQQQVEVDKAKKLLQHWSQPSGDRNLVVQQSFGEARNAAPDKPVGYIGPKDGSEGNTDARHTDIPASDTTATAKGRGAPTPVPLGASPEPPLPQDNLQPVDISDRVSSIKGEANFQAPVVVLQSKSSDFSGATGMESPSLASPKHNLTHSPGPIETHLFGYLDSDETMDQHLREWLKEMPRVRAQTNVEAELAATPKEFSNHAKNILAPGTLSSLHRFIRDGKTASKHLSRRKWLAVMRHFTSQPSTLNWTIMEAIFYTYQASCRNPRDLNVRPVFLLIQHLLATVPSSERMGQVLFPISAKNTVDAAAIFDLPVKYLQFYCEGQHSTLDCVRELGHILDVTKRSGLVPSKDLVTPVLRALVRARDVEMAETMLEGLTAEFGPTDSLALFEQYTFLNACEGNWAIVESMLDKFHTLNRSRSQPIEYGRFFERLLLQHIAKNPAARSFHFTVHAMKYAGLVPTNHVSRTLICAFIRDCRYDLAAEWLRLLKEAFPRVSSGFDLLQGAWLLTNTLTEIDASCEEIAKICQTIAHGHRKDPFGPAFREFAVDLVKADLSQRLCAVSAHFPSAEISDEEIRSMTMDQLLKCAYDLRAMPTPTGSSAAVVESLKNDLAVQISSIVDLAKVFRGEMKILFFGIKNQRDALLRDRRRVSQAAQSTTFPEIHRHGRPPGIGDLTTALAQHYHRRDKDGLPVDHSVLHHFVTRFGSEYSSEVLGLVEDIHASGYVQGPRGAHFDAELFKKWLYLVSTHGSADSAATALLAVSGRADQIPWTAHFRCLCEFVTQLGRVDNETLWDDMAFPKKPEGGPLRTRYEEIKRRWLDQGSWRKERFRFPEWKGWDLDGK